MLKICWVCGKEFEATRKDCKCCSKDCWKKLRAAKRRKSHTTTKCKYCGKIFLQKKESQVFCSEECHNKYHNKDKRKRSYDTVCSNCGKPITVTRKQTALEPVRFCCKKCGDEYRKAHTSKIKCPTCGKEFVPYSANQKYCSRICRDIAVFKSTMDEEKKRAFIEYYVKGRKPPKNKLTGPHLKISNWLLSQNILHTNEKRFKFFTLDILLTGTLGIEIMGRYWHKDSRYYTKDIFNDIKSKQCLEKDKRKNKKFKNDYGITILYLWEDDINFKFEMCQELIKKFIENDGNLSELHSSAYSFENNILTIISNPIRQYMEL